MSAALLQKVGSGISRAAATAHNPLHWFSGGHTHVYPRCDNDESAPVTPSAGMTASSDAGVVSMVSSIDDSALKGAPMSPGHVAFGERPALEQLLLLTSQNFVHCCIGVCARVCECVCVCVCVCAKNRERVCVCVCASVHLP